MTTKTPPIRQRCSQCRVTGQLDDKDRCQSCAVQIDLFSPEEVRQP